MSKNDEKLVKINYFENIRSHHPKSIIYWVTEGIIIDDKRYPIEEFRLKDDGLYAVVSKNDKEYFEVFLNTYDDTEILSQLKELNIRLTAEEQKVDNDTTYTAGNGLTLTDTTFSIDDTKVATQVELDDTNIRLTNEEQKNQEQDNRLIVIESKNLEQDNRLTELESNGQTQEQLYNVSTHTLEHNFSNGMHIITIVVKEKNEVGKVFGHLTFKYLNDEGMKIVHTIPLSQANGFFDFYVLEYDGYYYNIRNLMPSQESLESVGYTIEVYTHDRRHISSLVLNSVLYKETPNIYNEHIVTLIENEVPM